MPVRARLLDMGQVTPLRAHSLRLAVAEALGPGDAPALLVACAASSLVALGEDRVALEEVDLEACEARRVPVLRLPGDAPAGLIVEGDLLLSLVLPEERAAELNLPAAGEARRAWAATLLAEADGAERLGAGAVCVETIAGSLVLTAWVGSDRDPLLDGLLRRPPASGREGDAEESSARSPAELAESLLQLLEQRTGLELVPSMPLPEELDAVYEWDRKLVAAATPEAVAAVALPLA